MAVTVPSSIGEAYSRTGGTWERGPGRIYNRLAEIVVAASPVPLAGKLVLDHGAGTGAASRVIAAAGGRPFAADAAWGMLAFEAGSRPPAVVADAGSLPLRDGVVGAVVSAFCLNHLADPVPSMREIGRVTEEGGAMVVATYGEDDTHPVKDSVDVALTESGWVGGEWYEMVRSQAAPQLNHPDRARSAAAAAGWRDVDVATFDIPFPELTLDDLLAWRFGMAQYQWFLDELEPEHRRAVAERAKALLGGDPPILVRSILVLTAIR